MDSRRATLERILPVFFRPAAEQLQVGPTDGEQLEVGVAAPVSLAQVC